MTLDRKANVVARMKRLRRRFIRGDPLRITATPSRNSLRSIRATSKRALQMRRWGQSCPCLRLGRKPDSLKKGLEKSTRLIISYQDRDMQGRLISDEYTLEFLLGFDGRIHHLERGY